MFAFMIPLRDHEKLEPMSPELRVTSVHFISGKAPKIEARAQDLEGLNCLFEDLALLARDRERAPPRHAHFERLLAEATEVRCHLVELRERGQRLATFPLPCPPRTEAFRLEPIATSHELTSAGRSMHHCLAAQLTEALAGRAFLFHAMVGPEELTVEVVRRSGRFELGDIKGFANRMASPEALRNLNGWLLTVQSGEPLIGRTG